MTEDVKIAHWKRESHYVHAAGWTDERVETLKALWAEGRSASQIARTLGGGVTRNGVIGKVGRLGLLRRAANPAESARHRSRTPNVPKVPKLPRAPLPPEPELLPALTLEDGSHITLLTIGRSNCRWPIGHPDEADFHFCGQKTHTPGSPYCAAHMRVAYQPQAARRDLDRRVLAPPRYR